MDVVVSDPMHRYHAIVTGKCVCYRSFSINNTCVITQSNNIINTTLRMKNKCCLEMRGINYMYKSAMRKDHASGRYKVEQNS